MCSLSSEADCHLMSDHLTARNRAWNCTVPFPHSQRCSSTESIPNEIITRPWRRKSTANPSQKTLVYLHPYGHQTSWDHTSECCHTTQNYRFFSMNFMNLQSLSLGLCLKSPIQLAEMLTTHLDNIAILDNCSQQLSVLSFILLLFQISCMLKLEPNNFFAVL